MFDNSAFALAAIAVGAAAANQVAAPKHWRKENNEAVFREASGDVAPDLAPDWAPDWAPDLATCSGTVGIDSTLQGELIAAANRAQAPFAASIKRSIDIVLSLCVLLFLAPLLVLTAVTIKLDSKGPIFYRQRRVGFAGKEFELFKFRSMVTNAEINGPQYAAVNDSRVTAVGRIIRKFRIDEIPQTINVLRGEMSFVGPRPERPEFVRDLETEIPLYHCRHLVKPGITGWAQVKYEYAASVEGARNKLRYDLYYVRHFSPILDLLIVLMTVRVALFGLGSR